jgi:hypothetical protein
MKTITLPVWNRPTYLKRVIESLSKNNLTGYKLFLGVEPGNEQVIELCKSIDFIEKDIVINQFRQGVRRNPFETIKRAFLAGSEYNVHLEDDVVVSPDAFQLCNWYYKTFSKEPKYMHYGLFHYEGDETHPDKIIEIDMFNGYGWSLFKHNWESLYRDEWFNDKLCLKMFNAHGWDWAISAAYKTYGYKAIVPHYSRSQNIGREGGVFCTSEFYDKTFPQVKYNLTFDISEYSML